MTRCRRNWQICAQKREALQQEAAQVTAELAGLEERRRGAEAAFQRIDRLHADLERRVLAIEQQRAAAEAEREQRIGESAALAERQKELTEVRAEALALAQTLADAGAGAAPATGGDGDAAEDRARGAGPVARRPRRPLQRSWPSCAPIWSTLRQAAWPK